MPKIIKIKKGLNIKLKGAASSMALPFRATEYALVPAHFRWITPKMLAKEGDPVSVGTPVFCAKEDERIIFVSPVSGVVKQVVRGEKRKIEHVSITSDEQFKTVPLELPAEITPDLIKKCLLQYGLWNLLRERPFNRIANPDQLPKAIFVSGFDTAPLAPTPAQLVQKEWETLQKGIDILKILTGKPLYLSLYHEDNNEHFEKLTSVEVRYFTGKHPAGNIGTQIHHIAPINKGGTVWHITPEALVIIGRLFSRQILDFSREVALTGSALLRTGYINTCPGARITSLLDNNINTPRARVITGNVLSGKSIGIDGFLGYYDRQITVIPEGGDRFLLGWLNPGFNRWSFWHTYLSWLFPSKKFEFTTALHGGERAMMLHSDYDKVFPFDILPAELLKACIAEDIDRMEALGIYEVIEEDFALCEVICPSKIEWQKLFYKGLTLLR
ncbi:MAG: Na(+)-translocating NADH-quinone reductase subunit A [Bacteroidales bacterium]|jgi:Na+-transporting NADH:ubiquinone oxidoreductase subunit A|nr:Na(+)-translocating NADH-quinone reductase subunit A [Bacteroidales bacterium]